jgi:ribosomal protein S18 acetylase RimI-like enzyme
MLQEGGRAVPHNKRIQRTGQSALPLMRGVMRPDLSIRRGTHRDARCLSVLSTQVWLHTYATEGIRPAIARYVQEHLSPSALALQLERSEVLFLVAEIGGNLVGYASGESGVPCPLRADALAYLDKLYVSEHFHGEGVGRELLSRFRAELAQRAGNDALWLTVNSRNRDARTFYERQGLTDIGTTYFDLYGEKHENRVLCTPDA